VSCRQFLLQLRGAYTINILHRLGFYRGRRSRQANERNVHGSPGSVSEDLTCSSRDVKVSEEQNNFIQCLDGISILCSASVVAFIAGLCLERIKSLD
jgi:hypothetical protein